MTPLARAHTALALLRLDPGLGGLHLRARPCPARDAVVGTLTATRLHPGMGPDALDGGLDVTATLGAGTLTRTRGLLDTPGTLILPMAERASGYLAARLASALDAGSGHTLIALDEGIDDETLPATLADRLAFGVDLSQVTLAEIAPFDTASASLPLDAVTLPENLAETLVALCVRLGIESLRAASFALRATRAHAALNQRQMATDDDISAAAALTLAHRATQLPSDEAPEPDAPDETPDQEPQNRTEIPDEMLLDAVKAALPPDLLAQLAGHAQRGATGSGAGQPKTGNRRGRPLAARQNGDTNARVDLIATLRAAVPWQTLRRAQTPGKTGPHIRAGDLRRKRYQDHSDRLLIFAVDASGSAAMARMGEAKGAIELLLAEAYARRDHVALIAFRGTGAETLLEPTRSLVQTKRKLAALPGGGATPLAAGLQEAHQLALAARRRGLSPTVIALTDGRANMTLDGTPDRARAAQEAQRAGLALRAAGIDTMVIDTGRRPERALATLAAQMGGHYLALPRADARRLSDAVTATLEP
ncbi:magnesium chelatase subunit D [Sulfitobacter albidus]|uniref:Magnesium chelatase subunit D n=1 Tax=Sulfitobacter albidus TaxID=2829501 RepID=A0A975PP05_9RHOB|nr:magnesium chelatase subunit D [Sulfitobacter albidus]QUJ78392.1 magnesium chelatase subunit D [Sulfitobacter albidus]